MSLDIEESILECVKKESIETPAFVYSLPTLEENLKATASFCRELGVHFYYSIKSLDLVSVLNVIRNYVDGFAVSSYYEALLIDEIKRPGQKIHHTSPFFDPRLVEWQRRKDFFTTANSLNQLYCTVVSIVWSYLLCRPTDGAAAISEDHRRNC